MKQQLQKPFLITYSGVRFNLLNPTVDMINLTDIAHSLSMLCRWNGQCIKFYSVAEHSIHTSFLVKPEHAMQALLHDAAEAYLGDMITPVKDNIGGWFKSFENKIMETIHDAFGIKPSQKAVDDILYSDMQMVTTEAAAIIRSVESMDFLENFPPKSDLIDIQCYEPMVAEQLFIQRFKQIVNEQSGIKIEREVEHAV